MRDDAEARAARWTRTTPIDIRRRPAKILPWRSALPAAIAGATLRLLAPAANRVRDDCHKFVMRAWLDAASLVLRVGCFLLRIGLTSLEEAAMVLRWSCWLTRHGMLFRRTQRPQTRC